jgi:hypothetical protein
MSTATTAVRSHTNNRRPQLVDASGNPVAHAATNGNGQAKRETAKPIDEVRLGKVKAAIWQNTVDTPDGGFVRYGVTFERLYLNKDGQWRGTHSFGKDDLLLLAKVAEAAFSRINEMQLERPL